MARHGVPEQILTDNGKVFTARFGPGPGPVLFDRICANNGDPAHLDQAAFADHHGQGRALAQDAARRVPGREGVRRRSRTPRPPLDAWVEEYNYQPAASVDRQGATVRAVPVGCGHARARSRRADPTDAIDRGAGHHPAGQCGRDDQFRDGHLQGGALVGRPERRGGLRRRAGADLHHRGVLIATHARRHPSTSRTPAWPRGGACRRPGRRPPRRR